MHAMCCSSLHVCNQCGGRAPGGGSLDLCIQRAEAISEEYELAKGTRERLRRQISQMSRLQASIGAGGRADVEAGASDEYQYTSRVGDALPALPELYLLLNACLDSDDLEGAKRIKAQIDARR